MKSMTGFGSSERNGFKVEIRTLNHKFCEVMVRMPATLISLEGGIKKIAQEYLKRGRIEISITQLNQNNSFKKDIFTYNKQLAYAYIEVLKKMSRDLNIPFEAGLEYMTKIPGMIQQKEESPDLVGIIPIIKKLTLKAIYNVNYIREKEAGMIKKDFLKRIKNIEKLLKEINKRAPVVINSYREKLQTRLKKILAKDYDLGDKQVLNEVSIFAERSDITEEIVRLHSHLKQFRSNLDKDIPIGRTLDFILQEMTREINTIGSKANDYKISQKVILIKTEVEKLREQVQNVL